MSTLRADARGVIVACPSCGKANRLPFDRLADATRCGQCHTPLAAPGAPVNVTSSGDFDALVAQASLPVLVDFWAAWCAPCRTVAPEIARVAGRSSGRLLVVKVDTEAVSDLATRLGIRSIPTMALFRGGREIGRTAGARAADRIDDFVRSTLR